jgi:hypothetical protein
MSIKNKVLLGGGRGGSYCCETSRLPPVLCRGVGYMDVVEALLLYKNVTKIFLPISEFQTISYFKILINLRSVLMCYIKHLIGNISYFYSFIIFQYAGNRKMKRFRKQKLDSFHLHSFITYERRSL